MLLFVADDTISIFDEDRDKVKYTAYLNNVLISEIKLTTPPVLNSKITFESKYIKIGKENKLKIVITDSVGGEVTINETFIGSYAGLLFLDEKNNLLSTDLGEVLSKLNFGSIVCGQTSIPVEFTVWNNTTNHFTNPILHSPKDIDGSDVEVYNERGVFLGIHHEDGKVWVQLSLDDSFSTPGTFYDLSLPALASKEKVKIYARVETTDPRANPASYDFDISVEGGNE